MNSLLRTKSFQSNVLVTISNKTLASLVTLSYVVILISSVNLFFLVQS